MTTRETIVAQARDWIDVRYAHQGRTRLGTDCGGLIGGIAVELGIVPADWWQREFDPAFAGYGRLPNGSLPNVLASFMRPLPADRAQPGDVVMIRFDGEPQHLAVLADYRHGGLSVVHAMSRLGRVAEHRLDPRWQARIVAAFAYPGVPA